MSLETFPPIEQMDLHSQAQPLRSLGLDLVQPLSIRRDEPLFREPWFEQLAPAWVHEALRDGPLAAWVVGNSRALFEPFLRWVREEPQRVHLDHPLDTYVETQLRAALDISVSSTEPDRVWIGWAHQLLPCPLPMQRLAALSGLASLGPCGLAIHSSLGPWMALRALVVFPQRSGVEQEPVQPSSPCAGCSAPCVVALKRARGLARVRPPRAEPGETSAPPNLSARSRLWLSVRDACPVGKEHRYADPQLLYHYDKDRSVLAPDRD